jgi:nucleotide-binding universal stress UspA family protein
MNETEAIHYLTHDQETGEDTGHLLVPCSRWGRNGAECAAVAWDLHLIYCEANGAPDDERESLDFYMGLVVNDHDDVASLIREHGTAEQLERYHEELLPDYVAEAEEAGREAGHNAGSWALVAQDRETYERVLRGIEEGDPEIMDMQPAPLSGEWAGESIPELSRQYGLDLTDDDIATAFEQGYSDSYWHAIEETCHAQLDD